MLPSAVVPYALRIGRVIPRALPTEFGPMAQLLAEHRVRVTSLCEFSDPRLAEWLSDLEIRIALARPSVDEIVRACPVLGRRRCVPLANAIPRTFGDRATPTVATVRTSRSRPSSTRSRAAPSRRTK